jgi:RNA polymerase sigma factor (sigma-70 family)
MPTLPSSDARHRALELFEEHRDYADRMIRRLQLSRHRDREDLTQEALAELWSACLTFDAARGPMYAWAWRAVRRALIHTLRQEARNWRHVCCVDFLDADSYHPAVPEPSRQALEVADQVEVLLGRLRPWIAVALLRRFADGETETQIAASMGMSRAALSKRIHRALARLRERN